MFACSLFATSSAGIARLERAPVGKLERANRVGFVGSPSICFFVRRLKQPHELGKNVGIGRIISLKVGDTTSPSPQQRDNQGYFFF